MPTAPCRPASTAAITMSMLSDANRAAIQAVVVAPQFAAPIEDESVRRSADPNAPSTLRFGDVRPSGPMGLSDLMICIPHANVPNGVSALLTDLQWKGDYDTCAMRRTLESRRREDCFFDR